MAIQSNFSIGRVIDPTESLQKAATSIGQLMQQRQDIADKKRQFEATEAQRAVENQRADAMRQLAQDRLRQSGEQFDANMAIKGQEIVNQYERDQAAKDRFDKSFGLQKKQYNDTVQQNKDNIALFQKLNEGMTTTEAEQKGYSPTHFADDFVAKVEALPLDKQAVASDSIAKGYLQALQKDKDAAKVIELSPTEVLNEAMRKSNADVSTRMKIAELLKKDVKDVKYGTQLFEKNGEYKQFPKGTTVGEGWKPVKKDKSTKDYKNDYDYAESQMKSIIAEDDPVESTRKINEIVPYIQEMAKDRAKSNGTDYTKEYKKLVQEWRSKSAKYSDNWNWVDQGVESGAEELLGKRSPGWFGF